MTVYRPVIRWWSLIRMQLLVHFIEALEVHQDRLVFRKGLLSKSEIVIPFSRLTNFSASQGLIDRIFGVGNFSIETAGSTGPELVLRGYSYKLKDQLGSLASTR